MSSALDEAMARISQLTEAEQRIAQRRKRYIGKVRSKSLSKKPKKEKEGFFDRLIPDEDFVRGVSQIAGMIRDVPAGTALTLEAIGNDLRRAIGQTGSGPTGGGPDVGFTGTKQILGATAHQIAEDVRHPRRNIGYLGADILGALTLGAGTAARLGVAGAAYKATRGGRRYQPQERIPEAPPKPPPPKEKGPIVQAQQAPEPLRVSERFDWSQEKGVKAQAEEINKGFDLEDGGFETAEVLPGTFYRSVLHRREGNKKLYRVGLFQKTPDQPAGALVNWETGENPSRLQMRNAAARSAITHRYNIAKRKREGTEALAAVENTLTAAQRAQETPEVIQPAAVPGAPGGGPRPMQAMETDELAAHEAPIERWIEEYDRLEAVKVPHWGAPGPQKAPHEVGQRFDIIESKIAQHEEKGLDEVEAPAPVPIEAPAVPTALAPGDADLGLTALDLAPEEVITRIEPERVVKPKATPVAESAGPTPAAPQTRMILEGIPKSAKAPKSAPQRFKAKIVDDSDGEVLFQGTITAPSEMSARALLQAKETRLLKEKAETPPGQEPVQLGPERGPVPPKAPARRGRASAEDLQARRDRLVGEIAMRKQRKQGTEEQKKELRTTEIQISQRAGERGSEARSAELKKANDAITKIKRAGDRVTEAKIREVGGVSQGVAREARRTHVESTAPAETAFAGTISRATRATPRATGTSDRDRAIAPRGLKKMGIKEEAIPALQRDIRAAYEAAGERKPSLASIKRIFIEHFGETDGKRYGNEWAKQVRVKERQRAEGGTSRGETVGADILAGERIGGFDTSVGASVLAGLKAAMKRPRGGAMNIAYVIRPAKGSFRDVAVKYTDQEGKKVKRKKAVYATRQQFGTRLEAEEALKGTRNMEIVPIEVNLSNAALVRTFQQHRYRVMSRAIDKSTRTMPKWLPKESLNYIRGLYRRAIFATPTSINRHIDYQLRELTRFIDSVRSADSQIEAQKNVAVLTDLPKLRTQIKEAYQAAKAERADKRTIAQAQGFGPRLGRIADTSNQLATIMVLYTKPAYLVANYIGQAMFLAQDHYLNPVGVRRSAAARQKFFKAHPEMRVMVRELMQQGLAEGLEIKGGTLGKGGLAVATAHATGTKISNKLLDDWFREMTWFNEAHRHGFRSDGQIMALLRNESNRGKLIEVSQRANRNIVDYGRMSKFERDVVRRVVFFYPWIKGSSLYTLRFATEHPAQALMYQQTARAAGTRNELILGPQPSYAKGLIPFGTRTLPDGTKIPRVINPAAASTFGTLGDVAGALTSNIAGGVRPGDQLTQFVTPGLSLAASIALRRDLFTGEQFKPGTSAPEIAKQELSQLFAPFAAFERERLAGKFESGERDPNEVLFPYGRGEGAARWVGGVTPFSYNPKEGKSRAFAEKRSLAGAEDRIKLKYQDDRKKFLEAAHKTGLLRPGQAMPKVLRDAFRLREQRDLNVKAFEVEKGGELTTAERMFADVSLAVRQGRLNEQAAQQLLENTALLPDFQLDYLARKIRESYFAVPVIGNYKKAINIRLALRGEGRI